PSDPALSMPKGLPDTGGGAGMGLKGAVGPPELGHAQEPAAPAPASASAPNVTCGPVSFAPAVNYGAGTTTHAVAVGDFNRDGKQDLAAANYASNNVSVLLGTGTGTFGAATNFVTGYWPVSVAVG